MWVYVYFSECWFDIDYQILEFDPFGGMAFYVIAVCGSKNALEMASFVSADSVETVWPVIKLGDFSGGELSEPNAATKLNDYLVNNLVF